MIDELDLYELASFITVRHGNDDDDFDQIEDELYNQYGISIEQFGNIVSALLPFTQPFESNRNKDKLIYGFFENMGDGQFMAIIKKEVDKDE